MARTRRSLSLLLVASSLLVLGAAACSTGAVSGPAGAPGNPSATSAPSAAPTIAAAPTAAPTSGAAQVISSGEIRIGGLFNITGLQASQGDLYIKSAKMAVKEINDAGGINGKKLNLVEEDAQSSNPGCLAALNKAIEVDKVLVVLGTNLSTQIQASSDADKAAGVPFATGGTAVKNTHMGNPWIFRLRPDDSIAAAAMVQYIKDDMKLTKIGIINSAEAFGKGGADLVEQYSKEQGMTVVKRIEVTPGTRDYTPQLLGIKDAGAQVLVVYVVSPEDNAVIERQYQNLGAPYQVIGAVGLAMADTLKLAKDAAAGIYAAMDYMPGVTAPSKKYEENYQNAYGQPADSTSAYNYDAIYLFANAIKKVGEDRAKIRDAILGIHGDWEGVCGTFNFTPNGDGLHANTVVQIQPGGKYKFIRVVKIEPKS